jgi:hypothetical protein
MGRGGLGRIGGTEKRIAKKREQRACLYCGSGVALGRRQDSSKLEYYLGSRSCENGTRG